LLKTNFISSRKICYLKLKNLICKNSNYTENYIRPEVIVVRNWKEHQGNSLLIVLSVAPSIIWT
jgi:hypothetical protein